MDSKGWADRAVADLKRVAAAAKAVTPAAPGVGASAAVGAADPRAVGQALAELLKSDNSLTQSIAVRIANLAAAHPNKAY